MRELKSLTQREKIGQLIMAGFHGTEVTKELENLIREYKVGNILLFTRNVQSAAQLYKLNQDLQRIAMDALGMPMYISIDQEGGMVTRIFDDATFFPGAMTMAATFDSKNAYNLGDLMGKQLISLGINMNLAPVLDVNSNPKNPVIGVRSFSDKPEMVSEFGIANMKGMQNHVVATAKHFPGHGDTYLDSHLALPTVTKPLSDLAKFEFKPFKAAIDAGIKAIMSSHINFTALTEDGLPITLSKRALQGLLREEMGFEGLIVTDGIEMKAIHNHWGAIEATLMSVNAGANLVCICHDMPYQIGASDRLMQALETGELLESTLDERVERILKFKSELTVNLVDSYETVKATVEDQNSKQYAKQIVEDAVTLIKGETLKLKDKALMIATLPIATTIADEADFNSALGKKIKNALPNLDLVEIGITPSEEQINQLVEQAKGYDQIIFTSYNANVYQSQILLMNALNELGIELHVLAMRNPYDLYYAKGIKNYVAFYEYTPNSIEACIKYLKGVLIPKGKAPIAYE